MRFLFYSHDGLGLGHTRRHLAVAAALADQAPEAAILLATGAEDATRFGLPRQVEILKLPGLRKDANESYSARRLRVSIGDIRALRSSLLVSAVRAFRPDVVLVDKHPFGASGEFKAGLRTLKRAGGRAVLGLRDILDQPSQVLLEWRKVHAHIAEFYDEVLVYGDRVVYDPVTAYAFTPALAQRTRFCGYVLAKESPRELENLQLPFPPRAHRASPVVLATMGGGEDGFRSLETFIRACGSAPWHGVAVAGPMMPDAQLALLSSLAKKNHVAFRHFIPHLASLFDSVDALVTMGGYNTLVEAAASGVPTVCVPRIQPRIEQLMRAEAFARLGLLQLCHPAELTAEMLRAKLALALGTRPPILRARAHAALDFDGARRAATCLLFHARCQAGKRNTQRVCFAAPLPRPA
ncbi:MAG TPA: glycosyltransferase [Candidatus Limnocylindrales bacterium]|nr:glycosyltransferase [Candidatus Limnocylindrales bacterium]